MPTFDSGGVQINYVMEGEGRPVVLVHGFASSLDGNWRATGVIKALVESGRRVIALDCRGHGQSGKPHEPAAYGGTKMADDVIALMDHLGVTKADLMGYSMGGGISASLLARCADRFTSVILAGVGDGLILGGRPRDETNAIADAMEAPDGAAAAALARQFRQFAERTDNDLLALAAIQRSDRGGYDPANLANVKIPVMLLVGKDDTLVGSGTKIAATIPGCRHVIVPGDHLTALNREYREAVLAFLDEVSPVTAA